MAANDASASRTQGTLDLGAYVDVGDKQAVAIEQVDFIWQTAPDFGGALSQMVVANGYVGAQLTDLNPGTAFVRADDNSLIASAGVSIDGNTGTNTQDFYPDIFGKLDESRITVNDSLYVVAGNDNTAMGTVDTYLTCRIKARIVTLGVKDWISIAVQSTASDN